MTVDELSKAENCPNGQISATTTKELAAMGIGVASMPLLGRPGLEDQPLHSTVLVETPLDPSLAAAISARFERMPNPYRSERRR